MCRPHATVVSLSDLAVIRERQLMTAEVLERLPPEYREVIILCNLQDLSHAEIANRMNRSEGAVRMLWLRALEQLRKEITFSS